MHRSRALFFVAAALLGLAAATAVASENGKGIIRGTVTYGKQPVAGVTVSVDGGKKSAKTNDKGLFEFKDVVPGEYKVEASGIAKNTRRQATATIVVPADEKAEATVSLELK